MKLELWYPVKPQSINQGFGSDPAYYAKFTDQFGNPQKGHMGVDFAAAHGQPVHAAHDGMAIYVIDNHGGDGVHILTRNPLFYKQGETYFRSIYWHMCGFDTPFKPLIPNDGKYHNVRAGDLIGYADNSGAPYESLGDHLHFGLIPCNSIGNPVEPANGFGGCIDPMPYFNGYYAEDQGAVVGIYKKIITLLTNFLKK